MSIQTHKNVHLWDINEDIFAFWPCIDSNVTAMFKAQKGSKQGCQVFSATPAQLPLKTSQK